MQVRQRRQPVLFYYDERGGNREGLAAVPAVTRTAGVARIGDGDTW